jgi:hypothetical protein
VAVVVQSWSSSIRMRQCIGTAHRWHVIILEGQGTAGQGQQITNWIGGMRQDLDLTTGIRTVGGCITSERLSDGPRRCVLSTETWLGGVGRGRVETPRATLPLCIHTLRILADVHVHRDMPKTR